MKEQFLNLTGLTELVGYLKTSIANHKEILPYASNKLFPSVGDINTIYIDTATNTIYRWDSSSKTYITLAKAVKSVAISEATENGKITLTVDGVKTTVPIHGLKSAAFTESSAYSPAGHTHTKAQIGLGNVDNTADKDKSVKHASTADSATSAGTATTATNVNGENATVDAARHVWFSDSATETKRNYNDNFKYNPTTNTVTTNISGSAASANSVLWSGVTNKPSTFTPSAHNHDDSTITSLNASKLFGTIDIARLPHGALERLVIVADDTARFKLTTANVQLGDTVKVTNTEKMYYVVDESKLSSEAGYLVYTAGTATSVPWSGVTGKPSSYPPASHNHDERYYTETEMNSKLAEKATKVHTYVKSEVGLGNVDNTADANKSVKYAASAGTAASCTGNAATATTATKLATARSINGTNFYGSSNITTATWGTARNITIGSTKKSVNGGADVSWSLSEIGAAAASHSHSYLPLSGGTLTGNLNLKPASGEGGEIHLDASTANRTENGIILDQQGGNFRIFGVPSADGTTKTGFGTPLVINPYSKTITGGYTLTGALSGNASTASKWATARTLTLSGSVTGSASIDGSGNVTIATTTNHTHSYLPLSGGTMNGTAFISWSDTGNWSNNNSGVTFPVKRGGLSWSGQSDGIQLYAEETGNDNLELVLKFTDDNSNGLSIRNQDGNQTARINAAGLFTGSFQGSLSGNASTATKATQDSAGQQINTTYIKGLSVSGKTITYTKGNGTTGTITTQDTWRGIQNNLTSTATDQSLSAAQGKVLNDKIDAIQVGGRNLLINTSTNKSTTVNTVGTSNGFTTFDPYNTNNNTTLKDLGFKSDDKVTISFDWSISKNGSLDIVYGNFRVEWVKNGNYLGVIKNPVDIFSSTNTSGKVIITTTLDNAFLDANAVRIRIDSSVLIFTISKMKLEKGNKATDWTPAPEDIDATYIKGLSVNGKTITYTKGNNTTGTITTQDTNTWRPLGTTGDTACAGNDSRLSNARPASDVYSWAKASSKPSYSWGEITGKPSTFAPASHTHNYAGSSSAGGNANAAVKLATARSINGTNFDGSGNITTANWGTARTITVGNTGKSVNGSGNVSWSLGEIGVHVSNKEPAASDGKNGDVWIVYEG